MKGEKDRVKELEAEIKKLKIALADTTMENRVLEILIEEVNKHYQTDIKKFRTTAVQRCNEEGYAIGKLCHGLGYSRSGYIISH